MRLFASKASKQGWLDRLKQSRNKVETLQRSSSQSEYFAQARDIIAQEKLTKETEIPMVTNRVAIVGVSVSSIQDDGTVVGAFGIAWWNGAYDPQTKSYVDREADDIYVQFMALETAVKTCQPYESLTIVTHSQRFIQFLRTGHLPGEKSEVLRGLEQNARVMLSARAGRVQGIEVRAKWITPLYNYTTELAQASQKMRILESSHQQWCQLQAPTDMGFAPYILPPGPHQPILPHHDTPNLAPVLYGGPSKSSASINPVSQDAMPEVGKDDTDLVRPPQLGAAPVVNSVHCYGALDTPQTRSSKKHMLPQPPAKDVIAKIEHTFCANIKRSHPDDENASCSKKRRIGDELVTSKKESHDDKGHDNSNDEWWKGWVRDLFQWL
ncbi:hypothetical protein BJV82DRAFT_607094 [Fennellomyces sp. T-0311]|nr:hypothetical protein BJV82DRAFT_607094 [Fennellomyces sp. T-0311]